MPFSTEDALLANVAANRDDGLAKLVYADWLEEQGDEPRAQKAKFLRAEAELLKTKPNSKEARTTTEALRKLAYTLPHDWCPQVVHTTFPLHLLPDPKRSPGARRIIRTARTKDDINAAARAGFKPLVVAVTRNEEISSWVGVYQDPVTGEIETTGDHRGTPPGTHVVTVRFYPYNFATPYAAYLLPADLPPGEEVWLEDVIEDVVGVWGNQGHTYRLESCQPGGPARASRSYSTPSATRSAGSVDPQTRNCNDLRSVLVGAVHRRGGTDKGAPLPDEEAMGRVARNRNRTPDVFELRAGRTGHRDHD